jgi:hypothetical protein
LNGRAVLLAEGVSVLQSALDGQWPAGQGGSKYPAMGCKTPMWARPRMRAV